MEAIHYKEIRKDKKFLLCWPSSMKDVTSAVDGNCTNIINFAKNHPNI